MSGDGASDGGEAAKPDTTVQDCVSTFTIYEAAGYF